MLREQAYADGRRKRQGECRYELIELPVHRNAPNHGGGYTDDHAGYDSPTRGAFPKQPQDQRREIVRLPRTRVQNDAGDVVQADYILADLWQLEQYQAAFSYERQQLSTITNLIDSVLTSEAYGVVGYADGTVLLQRGVPSRPDVVQPWSEYRDTLQSSLSPGDR